MRISRLHIKSHARSHARSYNYRFCDQSVTITFFIGVSSDKQVIIKSYLQLGKKPLNSIEEQEEN